MYQLFRQIRFGFVIVTVLTAHCVAAVQMPKDNPASKYKLKWTDDIKWTNVVNITDFKGESIEENLNKAQDVVVAKGGGVVYFPPGVYTFKESIYLKDGVI